LKIPADIYGYSINIISRDYRENYFYNRGQGMPGFPPPLHGTGNPNRGYNAGDTIYRHSPLHTCPLDGPGWPCRKEVYSRWSIPRCESLQCNGGAFERRVLKGWLHGFPFMLARAIGGPQRGKGFLYIGSLVRRRVLCQVI
jgi:hypothetical protein